MSSYYRTRPHLAWAKQWLKDTCLLSPQSANVLRRMAAAEQKVEPTKKEPLAATAFPITHSAIRLGPASNLPSILANGVATASVIRSIITINGPTINVPAINVPAISHAPGINAPAIPATSTVSQSVTSASATAVHASVISQSLAISYAPAISHVPPVFFFLFFCFFFFGLFFFFITSDCALFVVVVNFQIRQVVIVHPMERQFAELWRVLKESMQTPDFKVAVFCTTHETVTLCIRLFGSLGLRFVSFLPFSLLFFFAFSPHSLFSPLFSLSLLSILFLPLCLLGMAMRTNEIKSNNPTTNNK